MSVLLCWIVRFRSLYLVCPMYWEVHCGSGQVACMVKEVVLVLMFDLVLLMGNLEPIFFGSVDGIGN